jgi:hypothetical protein
MTHFRRDAITKGALRAQVFVQRLFDFPILPDLGWLADVHAKRRFSRYRIA